ncbi:hypothetical protein BOTBODRAFT_601747, partial [Botryobasidium botryosum FD-172 SS1]
FISGAGLLSILSVFVVFSLVTRNAIIQKQHPFRSHIDIYVVSLFVSNIFEGVFAAMSIKWVRTGIVECEAHCSAQGFLNLFGQTGVAMNTLAIAVHTFCAVFFRWDPPPSKILPLCVVACIWLYNLGFAIGYVVPSTYVPTPFWCSLPRNLIAARIFSQYLWLCLTIITSITLYIILFFSLRGNIQITSGGKWYRHKFSISRATSRRPTGMPSLRVEDPHLSTPVRSAAKKMLWYPIAYVIISLPAVVIRFGVLKDGVSSQSIPFERLAPWYCLVNGAGVVNVVLFTLTRPKILLFKGGEQEDERAEYGGRNHRTSYSETPPISPMSLELKAIS